MAVSSKQQTDPDLISAMNADALAGMRPSPTPRTHIAQVRPVFAIELVQGQLVIVLQEHTEKRRRQFGVHVRVWPRHT